MENPSAANGILVENQFVRDRNVLVATADFTDLFVDYFLHLQDFGIIVAPGHASIFKEFLAAFTLHAASHPRNEVLAWTIQFQDPALNIFLGGDTELSTVAGRLFTEGLSEEPSNMFYQELVIRGKPLHRSIVPFEGNDPRATVAYYYSQSEQRPGRFFHLGEDRYCLLTAHPDWDRNWFLGLNDQSIAKIWETETLANIETRRFRWFCGCSHAKILDILSQPMRADAEGLFGSDESITVNCPRCAARYRISREAMEAHLESTGNT